MGFVVLYEQGYVAHRGPVLIRGGRVHRRQVEEADVRARGSARLDVGVDNGPLGHVDDEDGGVEPTVMIA